MKHITKTKRFLALVLTSLLIISLPLQVSAATSDAPVTAALTSQENELSQPVTLEITGLTNGVGKEGDKVTFKASGGTTGNYYLVIDVDSFPWGPRKMENGEMTLTVPSYDEAYDSRNASVLPVGLHFTVKAFRGDIYDKGTWEYSKEKEFDVSYESPAEFSLKATPATRIYNGSQWFSLSEPPVIYKNGLKYKDTYEAKGILRFKIYTEQDHVLVSQDGMLDGDVGCYEVTVWEIFKDDETGKTCVLQADPVVTKILPNEIRFDPGLLDGGKFTVDYDGNAHGIDDSQITVGGMSKDEYTLSYGYVSETDNTWTETTTAPAFVKPGDHTIQITASFPTSKLLKATAQAVVSIKGDANDEAVTTGNDNGNAEDSDILDNCEAHKIKYVLNGGTNNKKNPSEYGEKDVSLKAPSKKGYTFEGWFADKALKSKITKIEASQNKDITVYAKWKKVSVGKTSITSLKNSGSKKAALKVKKVTKASGYEIVYSTNKKLKNAKAVTSTKNTTTLKKLKKNKTYYVQVRAYKIDSTGDKVYGASSGVKQVKISK